MEKEKERVKDLRRLCEKIKYTKVRRNDKIMKN